MWIEYSLFNAETEESLSGYLNLNNVLDIQLDYYNGVASSLVINGHGQCPHLWEEGNRLDTMAVFNAFKQVLCGESVEIEGIGFVRPLHKQPTFNYSLCQYT